jgi:DNA polymerase-3 subunit chi
VTEHPIRIDFYVLESAEPGGRERLACRLAEKAYGLDHSVHALTATEDAARELDELLWTFRAGSFVPHELQGAATEAPVVIGCDPADAPQADLLINLTDEVPSCFDRFARVAEIIDADEGHRRAGRERFAFYRDNGYQPQTHRIG